MHAMMARGSVSPVLPQLEPAPVEMPKVKVDDLWRFEMESLDGLMNRDWLEILRRVRGHAMRCLTGTGYDVSKAVAFANQLVCEARIGHREWPKNREPNFLKWLFNVVREEITGPLERPARRQRRRGSRSSLTSQIRAAMNLESDEMKAIIEQLPTIALLVNRLNSLLDPILAPVIDTPLELDLLPKGRRALGGAK